MLTPKASAISGTITPKVGEHLPRCGRTAVQNITPIGNAPAEKSVTVQNEAFIDINLRPGTATPLSPYAHNVQM